MRVEDHNALTKDNEGSNESHEGGYATSLIIFYLSNVLGIRKEAATTFQNFAAKLKGIIIDEKDQIWLLLFRISPNGKEVMIKSRYKHLSPPSLRTPCQFLTIRYMHVPEDQQVLTSGPDLDAR